MKYNLYDFMEFPNKEERLSIIQSSPWSKSIILEVDYKKYSDSNPIIYLDEFDLYLEFDNWLRQFNNRIGEVRLTYIMLMHYYNMGIPDDPWYISPGNQGQSIQYFPKFEERHFCIKYYFDYYSDIFYYKIFGVWDSIYHLINVYYRIDINEYSSNFKKLVMAKLKVISPNLYFYMNDLRKNNIYIKANKLRNDLTHNFPSNDIDCGIDRVGNGVTIHKIGNYVSTKEFRENIDGILELLYRTLNMLKRSFEESIGKK